MFTNKNVFVELLFSCYLLVVFCYPMDVQNIQGGGGVDQGTEYHASVKTKYINREHVLI